MRTFTALTAACVVLTGCATAPKDIAPAYVSTAGYEALSCERLAEEAEIVSQRAVVASGNQDRQRGSDAAMVGVSLVLFWPAIFFVGGDKTQAAELARLKGEMQAIETVNRQKNCGIQFAPT